MITRKRKNPLHNINGIRYEIIDLPKYDEERVIRQFSEILNKKFKVIINYVPLILFKVLRGRVGELNYEPINADVVNIVMNSNYVNKNNIVLRFLFHELGHYLFEFYLSDETIDDFQDYVKDNTKRVNISQLIDLIETFSSEELKLKYPLRLLHSDNYRILKTLIPELRS